MDIQKLAILHDHYRDTCALMQTQRQARDRYFYLVLAVIAVVLFDLATPDGFSQAVGDMLRARLQLSQAPNLAYVRSVLWFLLLGLTIRYCQAALGLERQYSYVHQLEASLARHVQDGFTRESQAYVSHYPLFLSWAHYLYTLIFPVLLAVTAVAWTLRQIRDQSPWSLTLWCDCTVTLMLLASLAMYLYAVHGPGDTPRSREKNARLSSHRSDDTQP